MRLRILGGITIACIMGCALGMNTAHAVGPIVKITIAPATIDLSAGSTATFTTQGQDATGATTDLTANTVFSTTDPLGTINAATYTAGKTGTWVVTANYNDLNADAQMTVTAGPVTEVIINPNSEPEYLAEGKSRAFTGEAFDAFNNNVDTAVIEWMVEGGIGSLKSVNKSATRFTASETGSGTLTAYVGNARSTIELVVTKPVVTNTNTNAVTTTNASPTNTSKSTTNENTNSETLAPAQENTDSSADTANSSCASWPRQTWVWLFVGYLVLLGASLYPIRKMKLGWWWVAPLVLTVAALWIYYQFRCYPVYPALPYLILLASIIGTSWYNWQRTAPPPMK